MLSGSTIALGTEPRYARSLQPSIRPELVVIVENEKLGQAPAGTVHATLDRPDRHAADPGSLVVGEAFRSDEEKCFALFVRQLRQRNPDVGPVEPGTLLGQDCHLLGERSVRILDLVLALAVVGVELVA